MPTSFEVYSALGQLIWAIALLLPNHIFTNVSAKAYAPMAGIAPEWVWGLAFAFTGLVHLTGIILEATGVFSRTYLRRAMLMASTGLWGMVAYCYWQGNPYSALWGMWTLLALGCIWAYAQVFRLKLAEVGR